MLVVNIGLVALAMNSFLKVLLTDNTYIYKCLRQYTTVLVTNVTLFSSWRHVSAA